MQRKVFTLAQLAHLTQSTLIGNADHQIYSVSDLESAGSDDVSFLANSRYEQAMRKSLAGAIFIDSTVKISKEQNFLVVDNPSKAFQQVIEALQSDAKEISGFSGIHPSATIHPSAKLGQDVTISPNAVIEKNAEIGDRSFIGVGVYIGPKVTIGKDCIFHANVTIRERCLIGNRVILQPGVVVGSCGFGYLTDKQGNHTKLNQVGTVTLEDDVEIGANSIIERARFKSTKIGRGTKIGNLVVIGHNVTVGEHNIIVSEAGIAGSTQTGNHVILAGKVGIGGHLKLASGVTVAAYSGVSKSLTKAGKYGGIPAVPLTEYNRNSVHLRNIQDFADKIKELEQRIKDLEGV